MPGIIIGGFILGYTGLIIYKKTKELRAGKTCCGGCASCPLKGKCDAK